MTFYTIEIHQFGEMQPKKYNFVKNLKKKFRNLPKAHLPSMIRLGIQDMFGILDVKGAATDASASDKDTPTCAAFSAPQSLAPSPHIATIYPAMGPDEKWGYRERQTE